MPKDRTDLHVERWRDHWIDISFDDEVEAMVTRIGELDLFFTRAKKAALTDVGLQDFEYDTLHRLMIRDTPGRASPGDLARDLSVSGAGITGRLDGLEGRGFLKRTPAADDRRRIDIEVTKEGAAIWRRAMALRGTAEEELAGALSPKELATLNRLLKKLTLYVEERAKD